jgi:fructosamine-3-kinase
MSRRDIHYWKCDRPAAFHGTSPRTTPPAELEHGLEEELRRYFDAERVLLRPGHGQGNHLTWRAEVDGRQLFVRVEDGPDGDDHLAVESTVLARVAAEGVPVPAVFGCDASRRRVSFAWQALECFDVPDLNHWHRRGEGCGEPVFRAIGGAVARWQGVRPSGFGVLNAGLSGWHPSYADYFLLRLEQHLGFLRARGFLQPGQVREIEAAIDAASSLLELTQGCLVHKDLALWNILGSPDRIAAFIDFDDAISGDPMDDLSLLACFHGATLLRAAFEGYAGVRPLPDAALSRFWLHLLRNMIVKAVIRVGAGYFERDDGFFLGGGAALRRATHERLALALEGLRRDADLSLLP